MHTRYMRLVSFIVLLIASTSAAALMPFFAEGRAITGKESNGKSIMFPDVCKTPVPIVGVVPIPYPNIAMSSDKTAPTKVKATTKQPVISDGATKTPVIGDAQQSDTLLYALEARRGGQLRIRQYETTVPVTEATYVDHTGKAIRLQESALIELANGEYCAICVSRGKVTAVYRLVSIAPREKSTDTSSR